MTVDVLVCKEMFRNRNIMGPMAIYIANVYKQNGTIPFIFSANGLCVWYMYGPVPGSWAPYTGNFFNAKRAFA